MRTMIGILLTILAAFVNPTEVDFVTDARVNIYDVGTSINLHASRTGQLSFVAREPKHTTNEKLGFVIWMPHTEFVTEYLVFPHSAYRATGGGDYFITHQNIRHTGPNAGAEITVDGGATVWVMHGTVDFTTNGQTQRVVVDQHNYRYYPPVRVDL